MQRIYEAADIVEANIVKGMLEQCGISVHIGGYYLQGAIGEVPVSGIVSLWVEDEETEEARSVIESYLAG